MIDRADDSRAKLSLIKLQLHCKQELSTKTYRKEHRDDNKISHWLTL